MSPPPWWGRRVALAGLVAVAVLASVAAVSVPVWLPDPPPAAGQPRWLDPVPARAVAAPAESPPTRLRIPAIEVDAPLLAVGLGPDGALVPPTDYHRPGWYAGGTLPGRPGPAVIAGHVDSRTGPAVFVDLHRLRVGDLVEVARDAAWVRFTVTELAWYPKRRFPTDQVYGPTPDAQLRLITCGGGFDPSRRSYTDNLVVYAVAT